MKIGAQFYTVREHCQTLENLSESLKKIADIGYKNVQISGVCPYDATWLREELDKNGLACVLTHNGTDDLVNRTAEVLERHRILNCDYIGIGGCNMLSDPKNLYEDFVQKFGPTAEKIADGGRYFMYHNHDHEFYKLDGKLIFDRLAEDFPKEYMGFTLDTYWIQMGGGDPADWLTKLSGRVPCIHLKDFAHKQKMAVLGEGNLNFDRIFAAAEAAGTKYMLVEQDDCYGEDPFDCLKRSYEYLKARGFE